MQPTPIVNILGGLSRGGKINPAKIGGPSNDYAGHVFWDMDTWIMPPVMLFHPRLAKIMLESRTRILETAKENAQSTGFKGARFPWEQAVSGNFLFLLSMISAYHTNKFP